MRVPENFDLQGALSDVERDLREANRQIVRRFEPRPGTEVILYVTVRNSPILRDEAFVETELGYAVVHLEHDLLLYSSPHGPGERLRNRTARVEGSKTAALLDTTTTVTSVSLTNNDLSDWAVRSRSLSSRDLAEIAAEVGDSTFGFSTANGHLRVDNKRVQRYARVKNGRISDRRGGKGTFGDLLEWFDEIKNLIRADGTPPPCLTDTRCRWCPRSRPPQPMYSSTFPETASVPRRMVENRCISSGLAEKCQMGGSRRQ